MKWPRKPSVIPRFSAARIDVLLLWVKISTRRNNMAALERVGDLEIEQNLAQQRREWTIQRIGWVVMVLLALAALLGLFGGGPFSEGTAGDRDGPLWVEYPRFARLQAPAELRLHVGSEAVPGNEARVWLDRDFIENVQIQHITPEPDRVELGRNN
jgi:hypothetical protein